MNGPRMTYRDHRPASDRAADYADSSTPKFADDGAHILRIAQTNGGRGFPFVAEVDMRVDPRPPGGLKGILLRVASDNDLTVEQILSDSRKRTVSWPRQEFMWRARQVKWPDGTHRYSLPFIGDFLGCDHTTVMHGVRAYQSRMDEEAAQDLQRWTRLGEAAA